MSDQHRKDFFEQFRGIGLDLARRAKNIVKDMKLKTSEQVDNVNDDFIHKIFRDLQDITIKFMKEYEYQLNQQISENFRITNKRILQKKTDLYQNFIQELHNAIKQNIESNYPNYSKLVVEKLTNDLKIVNFPIIQLNQRDVELKQQIINKIGNSTIKFDATPISTIGGYILTNQEKTIVVNRTYEEVIKQNLKQIKSEFGNMFPKYIDKRTSASDMIAERNMHEVLKTPEELDEFINSIKQNRGSSNE